MVYAEAGERIPVSGVQVTKNTLTHRLPGTRVMFLSLPGVGGDVLTIAHALQEVFEGLSQLPWLQSDEQNML